jgi:alkylation response protein AidB-like acyl-CoA dehydrogenase
MVGPQLARIGSLGTMSDYRPPIPDIRFVLDHIADIQALADLGTYANADPDLVFGALDEAGRLAAEVIAPTNRPGDEQGSILNDDGTVTTPEGFKKAYRQFVDAGWPAVAFPEEWGGGGIPWVAGFAVAEMVTTANMAFSLCPMLTYGANELLLFHGTDEQKAAWLPKLVAGEWTGTMVLTEDDAGSDVGALRTKAVPADDGTWKITGNKIFITWGDHDLTENIVHMVLARTPDAPPGTRGISTFIVPKYLVNPDGSLGERNDVSCVSIEHKLGIHASPTCVLSFGDTEGAVGYLVGEENQGMRYMFTMMNTARLQVGLQGLAVAERAYQDAVAFAMERRQGRAIGAARDERSLIVEHPDVRRTLMLMKAQTEAMRCLLYKNAEAFDLAEHHPDEAGRERGAERAAILTPISKAWASDVGCEITSLGIQVLGGLGYVEESGMPQHFRDARITPIYEGTNGIQAADLATRKLPLRGGEAVAEMLDEMRGVARDLDAAGLDPIGARLSDAVDAVATASEWLLSREDPNDVLAGATPYLEMFGITAGGWLLGVSALAAAPEADTDAFLQAKVDTARFYAEHVLPEARGLLSSTTAGAQGVFAVPTGQFAG